MSRHIPPLAEISQTSSHAHHSHILSAYSYNVNPIATRLPQQAERRR
jgi:hypothetical protein